MKNVFSKTQIDRLGDRLREGSHTESDLRLLDDYRMSFGEAYEAVIRAIRQRGEFPTGRLAKSTRSIVEKLRRESIRLTQMQDIAGCRIVAANIVQQEQLVSLLATDFPGASVMDRRDKPSYGYRAVHVIVEKAGKPIEIQVRTALQHLWAELSEKSSNVLDPTIKYGGGSDEWRIILTAASELVADSEESEKDIAKSEKDLEELAKVNAELEKDGAELEKSFAISERLFEKLSERLDPTNDVQAQEKLEEARREFVEDRGTFMEMRSRLEEMRRGSQEERRELKVLREELLHQRNEVADLLAKMISWLDNQKEQMQ